MRSEEPLKIEQWQKMRKATKETEMLRDSKWWWAQDQLEKPEPIISPAVVFLSALAPTMIDTPEDDEEHVGSKDVEMADDFKEGEEKRKQSAVAAPDGQTLSVSPAEKVMKTANASPPLLFVDKDRLIVGMSGPAETSVV